MRKNHLHLLWDRPENIRKLRSPAERIVLLSTQLKIDNKLILHLMSSKRGTCQHDFASLPAANDLQRLESDYVRYLLKRFHGDRGALCQYLGISCHAVIPENIPPDIRRGNMDNF